MEKNSKKDNRKEIKLGIIVLIVTSIICIVSVSYAIWNGLYKGQKENTVTTGSLVLNLNDNKDLSLVEAIPVSDTKGMSTDTFDFTIENTGTIDAKYAVYLDDDTEAYEEDGCSDKKLAWKDIKYAIEKQGDAKQMNFLSDVSGKIYETTVNAGETDSFSLNLWISSTATNDIMGKHFHGKLRVEAIQSDKDLTN